MPGQDKTSENRKMQLHLADNQIVRYEPIQCDMHADSLWNWLAGPLSTYLVCTSHGILRIKWKKFGFMFLRQGSERGSDTFEISGCKRLFSIHLFSVGRRKGSVRFLAVDNREIIPRFDDLNNICLQEWQVMLLLSSYYVPKSSRSSKPTFFPQLPHILFAGKIALAVNKSLESVGESYTEQIASDP